MKRREVEVPGEAEQGGAGSPGEAVVEEVGVPGEADQGEAGRADQVGVGEGEQA